MAEIESCPECNVPTQFVNSHVWLAGGIIVQANDRTHRMVMMESDNLDPLYEGIVEIIGVPIERIIIETKRRATREYISRLVPAEIKESILKREMSVEPMIEALNVTSNIMGYGKTSLVAYRFERDEDDFVTERIENPYSVPLWCGDLAGSTEAVTTLDNSVTYERISENTIEVTSRPSEHPPELKERLQLKEQEFSEGGIELERCPACGGPAGLASFEWHPEKGVIISVDTGRRIAMLGPHYQEAIFDELERELGETIPKVIIEAQRRFVKTGFYHIKELEDQESFRRMLALRGLGDLQEITLSKRGLKVVILNAAVHLMMAGLLQGYYETMTRSESEVDWEMSADGTLELNITAKA